MKTYPFCCSLDSLARYLMAVNFPHFFPLHPTLSFCYFIIGYIRSIRRFLKSSLLSRSFLVPYFASHSLLTLFPTFSPSFFSPFFTDTVATFDQCGGFSTPPYRGPFSAPITGYYHYSAMPGLRYPNSRNITSKSYCPEIKSWYNETKTGHSPLVGFMADGIPIYGPFSKNGHGPKDLDSCGGHATDSHSFYHYHFQTKYPYSVNCLRGCVDGSMNKEIESSVCIANKTLNHVISNYTSLQALTVTYGGYGVNSTNWTGPACLLAFGFIIFLPSALFCMCICCSTKKEKENIGTKGALSGMEEYDEHTGDNVL